MLFDNPQSELEQMIAIAKAKCRTKERLQNNRQVINGHRGVKLSRPGIALSGAITGGWLSYEGT